MIFSFSKYFQKPKTIRFLFYFIFSFLMLNSLYSQAMIGLEAQAITDGEAPVDYAGMTAEGMLALLTSEQGDEAWELTISMIDKLKSGESFSLPCMKGNVEIMTTKINDILSSSHWLLPDDKQGLEDFIEYLGQLRRYNFPYHESVSACFIFSSILKIYYVKEGMEQRSLGSSRWYGATTWDASTIKEEMAEMLGDFQRTELYPYTLAAIDQLCSEEKLNMDYQAGSELFPQEAINKMARRMKASGQKPIRMQRARSTDSSYRRMLCQLFENKYIYWPVFCSLNLDDSNLTHYLPLIPVRFTVEKSIMDHNGCYKDCNRLPYSCVDDHDDSPSRFEELAIRKQSHQVVQCIYRHLRSGITMEPELISGIRLSLFQLLLGFQGRSNRPIGSLSGDDVSGALKVVQCNLHPMISDYQPPYYGELLSLDIKTVVTRTLKWWQAFHYVNESYGCSASAMDFHLVHRHFDELESEAIVDSRGMQVERSPFHMQIPPVR